MTRKTARNTALGIIVATVLALIFGSVSSVPGGEAGLSRPVPNLG